MMGIGEDAEKMVGYPGLWKWHSKEIRRGELKGVKIIRLMGTRREYKYRHTSKMRVSVINTLNHLIKPT
jgi:hypothetical protein